MELKPRLNFNFYLDKLISLAKTEINKEEYTTRYEIKECLFNFSATVYHNVPIDNPYIGQPKGRVYSLCEGKSLYECILICEKNLAYSCGSLISENAKNVNHESMQKWGVYGDPYHKRYYIKLQDLIPGMWFTTNPDSIPFFACRDLCREVSSDCIKADSYSCGMFQMKRTYNEHLDCLAEFILDEQPYICVVKLMEKIGKDWSNWQKELLKTSKTYFSASFDETASLFEEMKS